MGAGTCEYSCGTLNVRVTEKQLDIQSWWSWSEALLMTAL